MKKKISTVMVKTSTNINKPNNRLSHQIIEHKKDKTYDIGKKTGLGQAQKCGRFKPKYGISCIY